MKILGIIAEYNPFHNGHAYQIENAKRLTDAEYTVCVMSGNYIQRGEPALINKWARTKMALLNGIDLVIELPVTYVLQSAEFFAYGSVKILDSLGIVTDLCFGSESGEIEVLKSISSVLANEPEQVSISLKEYLKTGISFAEARQKSVINFLDNQDCGNILDEVMGSPNNILGIEYIKALLKLNSSIKPSTIKRFKTDYHSLEQKDEFASATGIRNFLLQDGHTSKAKPYMPPSSYDILYREIVNDRGPISTQDFNASILTQLRKLTPQQISGFPDVNEGLENRILHSSLKFGTCEEVIDSIKTKRYTRTRIQRILFNILIGITKNTFNLFEQHGGPQYIRILGMNEKGKKLLKIMKDTASLPIITKPAAYKESCNSLARQMIELDFLATDLYTLNYRSKEYRQGRIDLLTSPIIR